MATVAESLRNLGAVRIVAVVAAALALIIILFFISMRLTSPVMSILYSEVPVEDASKIVAQLDSQGIKYELRAGGTQILVPSDQVLKIRMTMAGSGLPSRGSIVGYEIFDKSDSLGTSNFVYNVNLIRALEGELSRTIASFSNIDSARVHLVIPKRELFVKDKTEPSASVILKVKGHQEVERHEVLAISNFIASAVPGLKPGRVTIVDNNGTLLSRGGGDDDYSMMASTNQEYKANYEKRLKSTIEELLEKSVGLGKVEAQVSVDMDFDRMVINSETYDPDSQVARSTQTVEERDQSNDKEASNVTVANNLPDVKLNSGSTGSSSNSEKTDETKNFEISKTVTNQIKEPGKVKKISVAVLVDGTYAAEKDSDGKDKNTYSPRSQEELDKLKALVKSTMGFDEKRGDTIEMVNMQFTRDIDFAQTENTFDWLKRDFDSILKTLVIGVVAVLVILLVIKPLVNRAFEISPGETGDQITPPAAAGPSEMRGPSDVSEALGGIDIDKISNRVVTSSIKKISTVVETNPEETLAVIREWLNQR